MAFLCRIGKHSSSGCKCSACGATRDQQHDWHKDCEKCGRCGLARVGKQRWPGCKCDACCASREQEAAAAPMDVTRPEIQRESAEKVVKQATRAFFEKCGTSWTHQPWLEFLNGVRATVSAKELSDAEIGQILEAEAGAERQRRTRAAVPSTPKPPQREQLGKKDGPPAAPQTNPLAAEPGPPPRRPAPPP